MRLFGVTIGNNDAEGKIYKALEELGKTSTLREITLAVMEKYPDTLAKEKEPEHYVWKMLEGLFQKNRIDKRRLDENNRPYDEPRYEVSRK